MKTSLVIKHFSWILKDKVGKREQNIVNSWELGNGSARFIEATEESVSNLSLNLASIWKNETIDSGQLVSQVFDAQGYGTLVVISMMMI